MAFLNLGLPEMIVLGSLCGGCVVAAGVVLLIMFLTGKKPDKRERD